MPVLNVHGLIEERVAAIRYYHKKAGMDKAQLDVSGGVDSAVMLGLLATALGPENVIAVYSNINSSEESCRRAHAVCKAYGVSLIDIDLTGIFHALVAQMGSAARDAGYDAQRIAMNMQDNPAILGSLRSCLRAPIGRGFNRQLGGGIRHGTGNEDEDRFLRFYQKGGDGEVDTNPLGMLSKGEVYQLATGLGVPREIVDCEPTPDLWGTGAAHNDEAELKKLTGVDFTYSRVDYDTGEYTRVGTIERVNRWCDELHPVARRPFGELLFSPDLHDTVVWQLNADNANSAAFGPLLTDQRYALLMASRKFEKATKHKENPNIPMLGDPRARQALRTAKLITDTLPIL